MDVYGVDPSLTCTGLAKTTPAGVILTKRVKTAATGNSLGAIRKRVRYIVGQVIQFAPEGPFVSVIEAPYVPPKMRAGSVIERAWLFGMLVDQLILRGAVVQVAPASRAMYATDRGNASKKEVLAAMRARFPELTIQDDNEADGLALLCMGARWLGEPIDGEPSEKQVQAMVATHWPELKEERRA